MRLGQWDVTRLLVNVLSIAAFTVYTVGSLWLADTLLSMYLPGYVFSGNYKIGAYMFFIVTLGYIYWAQWRSWTNWRYYIFGAIAVFFPLVFVASAINISVNPSGPLVTSFSNYYCQSESDLSICGKAFAAIVSGMALRALPAVLTVPFLLYILLIHPRINRWI